MIISDLCFFFLSLSWLCVLDMKYLCTWYVSCKDEAIEADYKRKQCFVIIGS